MESGLSLDDNRDNVNNRSDESNESMPQECFYVLFSLDNHNILNVILQKRSRYSTVFAVQR